MRRKKPATPAAWTAHLRRCLRLGGSPAIARSTQRFFTEPVRCYGWKPATPAAFAAHLRRCQRQGGSPAIARSMQRFFTEPVRCYGWKTAELRRFARRAQHEILADGNLPTLLQVEIGRAHV